jgi:hypothetical protein
MPLIILLFLADVGILLPGLGIEAPGGIDHGHTALDDRVPISGHLVVVDANAR